MRSTKYLFIILIGFMIGFSGCEVLNQASEVSRLMNCEFKLQSVQNLNLAGINVQNIKSVEDLALFDMAKLSGYVMQGNLPLSFTLNVDSKNPNDKQAAMNKLDWILYIDDIEMTRGVLNDRIEIAPNGGQTIIPLGMSFNLMEVLSGASGSALLNFGMNLAGSGGKPTRFMLKAKPTIYVGGQAIEYPGYLKIKTDFVGR